MITLPTPRVKVHFHVTMWSPTALDHVVSDVWAVDAYNAIADVREVYPADMVITDVRLGTADDLD